MDDGVQYLYSNYELTFIVYCVFLALQLSCVNTGVSRLQNVTSNAPKWGNSIIITWHFTVRFSRSLGMYCTWEENNTSNNISEDTHTDLCHMSTLHIQYKSFLQHVLHTVKNMHTRALVFSYTDVGVSINILEATWEIVQLWKEWTTAACRQTQTTPRVTHSDSCIAACEYWKCCIVIRGAVVLTV